MKHTQVGNCPNCGAPIYIESKKMLEPIYTCRCYLIYLERAESVNEIGKLLSSGSKKTGGKEGTEFWRKEEKE